jgi:hypothetical protein
MTEVHLFDDKPAKEIEQILRTKGAEAALQAYQQCATEATAYGANYKTQFNDLTKELQKDGALTVMSLQWAKDRDADLFAGSKTVTQDDLNKAMGPQQYWDRKNGQDPNVDADVQMSKALAPSIDPKKGLDITSIDALIKTGNDTYMGKGGGLQCALECSAKKFLDDGANGSKLFDILAVNSGHTDGRIEKGALDNFLQIAQAHGSTYLQSLGYKPEENASVIAAVKNIRDHYDEYSHGWWGGSFSKNQLAQGLNFANLTDMNKTFKSMDDYTAAQAKAAEDAKHAEQAKTKQTAQNNPQTKPAQNQHPKQDQHPKQEQHQKPEQHPLKKNNSQVSGNVKQNSTCKGLPEIPKVEAGEGYYQVAQKWLAQIKKDASVAEILDLTHSLQKANDHRTSLKVGEKLKFDPESATIIAMTKESPQT